jgi:hypothetical protein
MSKKADDSDPWKRDVEKVSRSASKGYGKTVKRSATTGRYVTKAAATRHPKTSVSSKAGRQEEKGIEKVGSGNDGNRHVVPNRDRGGWDVVKENHARSSGHFETQKEAIDRARQIVEKTGRGNGEIVIHGKDGKIRDSDSGSRNESKARDRR